MKTRSPSSPSQNTPLTPQALA
uniref:Uncharacterized protein n=1 Tax=Anguilla anguilla TaxID=7936 RepID=A0A0E9RFP8_ANGAN